MYMWLNGDTISWNLIAATLLSSTFIFNFGEVSNISLDFNGLNQLVACRKWKNVRMHLHFNSIACSLIQAWDP